MPYDYQIPDCQYQTMTLRKQLCLNLPPEASKAPHLVGGQVNVIGRKAEKEQSNKECQAASTLNNAALTLLLEANVHTVCKALYG